MPGRTLGRQPPVKLAGVAFGGLIRGSRSRRAAGARAACERLRACFRPKSGIGSPGSFRGGMATGTGPGLRGHHCPCQCGGLPRAPSRSSSAPTEVATSQNPATHRVRSPHLLRDHVHRTHTPHWGLGLEGGASCTPRQGQGRAPAPPWGLASRVVSGHLSAARARRTAPGFLGRPRYGVTCPSVLKPGCPGTPGPSLGRLQRASQQAPQMAA